MGKLDNVNDLNNRVFGGNENSVARSMEGPARKTRFANIASDHLLN